jgi:predicted nucleic acid-binding protein
VPIFVDTNIFIYALDSRDAAKQQRAQTWLTCCWAERSGRVSAQVLNELYINLVRLKGDAFKTRARAEVGHLFAWNPCAIDTVIVETAWTIADEVSISHGDALIIAAAAQQNCETLLSEDLQHGQVIEGVQILNPFLD